jgi:hypothetical protein
MKNLLLLTCLLAFAANCLFAANEAVKPEGEGTVESPYLLTKVENLVWMGNNIADCKSSVFCLGNDIDASETEYWESQFIPIGMPKTTYGPATDFGGVLDGNNYTIKGLHSRDANSFIRSLHGAKVSNLYLEDVKFSFSGVGAGGLAIYCDGSVVTNVHVSGKIEGATYVGGVCGNVDGSQIVNCSFMGSIVGFGIGSFGGVVGESAFSDISYCKTSGYIDSDKEGVDIGGICGKAVANDSYSYIYPRIRYCIADMKITAQGNIGGIVAQNYIQNVRREAFGDVVIKNRGLIDNYSLCVADSSMATTKGGICAAFGETSIDINNFYDRTGISGTVFGKGLSPENMKRKASFTNWDFDNVWTIQEEESTPYWRICNGKPYRVVCFSNFPGTLSITPEEKSYALNDTVTINISTPENGVFIGFKEGLGNTETNISLRVKKDLTIVGVFAKYIDSANEFLKIGRDANYPDDGYYIQTSDIDMSESNDPTVDLFYGVYDGNFHAFRNIKYNDPGRFNGLFSKLIGAKICNLGIINVKKNIHSQKFGFLGGEVNASEVRNCYVISDVENSQGGLCYEFLGSKMIRCEFRGTIYDVSTFGGLANFVSGSSFEECSVEIYGSPNIRKDTIGGFANFGTQVSFLNSYVKGDCLDYAFIKVSNKDYDLTFSNCYVFAENECVLDQAQYFNCYFNSNCVATVEGVTGFVSPEEMKRQETYAGWDFENVWDIEEGVGTPYFRYALPEPIGMFTLLLLALMAVRKR